jgi:8-oxo-dGTP diphosphatase
VQKRSPDRVLFPGCWDIPGGHVEPDETLYQALAREIEEETGWQLTRLVTLVDSFDWDTASQGEPVSKREFDFLVEVQGDLDRPQLEQAKELPRLITY